MGWAIALHGGAGDIPFSLSSERKAPREEALRQCLNLGVEALKANGPALDVVELVGWLLELGVVAAGVVMSSAREGGGGNVMGQLRKVGAVFWPLKSSAGASSAPSFGPGAERPGWVARGQTTPGHALGRESALPCTNRWPHHGSDSGGGDASGDGSGLPPSSLVVVRELENNRYFNAGIGSVLTSNGTVEMEACIMDGKTKKCGAVSGLSTVVNAISLARLVMDKTPHIYLAFDGAEVFAREQGVETVDAGHFITQENIERLKQAKEANRVQIDYTQPIPKESTTPNGDSQLGTVGCVAVDTQGNLATATSTGGLVNKMLGRIGDTPIIGAGTYANGLCAVSATGKGEAIMQATVARDVAALMEYKGLSLKDAAKYVIEECTPRGTAGLVAVSGSGEITMPFNTTGMFRACATEDGHSEIAIWTSD
ncbi:hypothetical protein Scep_016901 [Stephania cephalantha]|uniref:beta-aspartyl-peptidase n=1 Tax=Stephania cephalantha TaxID=152367 RepID=A0AAP0NTR5_9MAGN